MSAIVQTDYHVQFELMKLINEIPLNERNYEGFLQYMDKTHKDKALNIKSTHDTDELFMISNNYDNTKYKTSPLERECKSIVMRKSDLRIICYTHDDIYYNEDAKDYMLNSNIAKQEVVESFEGTMLSVFYHKKWHVATRKCLRASESKWIHKSYMEMFKEILTSKHISEEEFFIKLDKSTCYFLTLIHHENKSIIDYSEHFGTVHYQELVLVMARNQQTHQEIDIYGDDITRMNESLNGLFKLPTTHTEFNVLETENKKNEITLPLRYEGVMIKTVDKSSNKIILLKLQTNAYQMMSILNPNNNNIYKTFIELYQQGLLKKHIEYFKENKTIYNPIYMKEQYDTVGVIDASFKVLTSEFLELYKMCYSMKTGYHKNKDIYNTLQSIAIDFKIVFYTLRGKFFQKRDHYFKTHGHSMDASQMFSIQLRIVDIYTILKEYNTNDLIKLFRARYILKTQINNHPKFNTIRTMSNKCCKIKLKMMDILCSKLFPTIAEKQKLNVSIK